MYPIGVALAVALAVLGSGCSMIAGDREVVSGEECRLQPHVYNSGFTYPFFEGSSAELIRLVNENTAGPYSSADELVSELRFADGQPDKTNSYYTGGPDKNATLVTSFPPDAVDQLWSSYNDAVAAAVSVPPNQIEPEFTQTPYRMVEVLGYVNKYTDDTGQKDGELDDGVQLCVALLGTVTSVPADNMLWRQQFKKSDEYEGE